MIRGTTFGGMSEMENKFSDALEIVEHSGEDNLVAFTAKSVAEFQLNEFYKARAGLYGVLRQVMAQKSAHTA
jgi:hypothetical protein